MSTRARRTWPQRLFLLGSCLVILFCLAAAGGLVITYGKVSDIGRVTGLGSALDVPAQGSTDPVNYLIVGVDSGEGLDPSDPVLIGRPGGLRSDTIIVVRLDPKTGSVATLSLPRDLWIPIAGLGGRDRINSAIQGGPSRLIATIKQDFGIPINHYVEIDFLAFRKVVAALDGVPIYFPNPARDLKTGLQVDTPGCTVLDPVQALAFARSRAYEEQVNGHWRTDPTADLGRISRQQLFLKKVLRRAVDKGARNPVVLNDLLDAVVSSVSIDPTLTVKELADLGRHFSSFDPDALGTYTVPTTGTNIRGASVLLLDNAGAEAVFARFRDVVGQLDPNASIVVQVNNGTGQHDQAGKVADDLRRVGFTVPASNVGEADRFDYERTTIWYRPDTKDQAQKVASYLRSGAVLEPARLPLVSAGVLVITGADYAGVDPGAAASTTTTTIPTATTVPGEPASTTSTTVTGTVPKTPEDVNC